MKIAMFTDAYWPRVNGVTVSVDSFSKALVKMGHEVLIICSHYPQSINAPASIPDNSKIDDGIRILRVPSISVLVSKEDRVAKFNRWFWVFKQVDLFNPQIVHIHSEFMIAEFGFFYAWTHNLPAIYTFHTMWEDYGPNYFSMFPVFIVKFVIRGILKNILRRSYKVIVPSPQIGVLVKKYKPKTKTFLLPTGIDPELFIHDEPEVNSFREKLENLFPRLKGKRILLFAGRVTKEKISAF